jgi:hypothetical protein
LLVDATQEISTAATLLPPNALPKASC